MTAPRRQTIPRPIEGFGAPQRRGARVRADPGAPATRSGSSAGRSLRAAVALGLFATLLLGAGLPPSLHAPLLLRLHGYDRRFAPDAPLYVLLVDDGLPGPRSFQDELERALRAASKGRGAPSIQRGALGPGFAPLVPPPDVPLVVVLAPGLAERVAELRVGLGATPVLTIGSDEASVRAGLALGIVREADRPRVLVNLAVARTEGARLDAGLLRLAQTVDAPPGPP